MALVGFKAPPLPLATGEYSKAREDQLVRALQIYFNRLDSLTPNAANSYTADNFIGGEITLTTALATAYGGTGGTTQATARTGLGLGTMAVEAAADYLPLTGGTLSGTLLGTKIGLGTTPGTYQYLHIAQSIGAAARPIAIFEDTSAGAGSRDILELKTAAAAAAFKFTNDTSYWRLLIGSSEQFRFDSATNVGVLNIMKDGKVGINDTSPAEALSVTGNIAISGTKVIGTQGAAVADATDAASAITQLNALLARMRAHGLIAT